MMKKINIIIVFFFISLIQITKAQISPIEKIVEGSKITYNTSQFTNMVNAYKNQPYDVKQKLEMIKIDDIANNNLFINNCLNSTTYSSLQNSNARLFIDFVCNQNGNVLACRFIIYKTTASIGDSEIKCISNEVIKNKFIFNNIPDGVNSFYTIVRERYKLQNHTFSKPDKLPDLDEGQY